MNDRLNRGSNNNNNNNKIMCFQFVVFLLMAGPAMAMITIVDTGARFASHTDRYYGTQFKKGYRYSARLQYVEGNLNLCPSGNDVTRQLVVPSNGLSIALLVHSGGCSLRDKVEYIRNYLYPSNYVQYLILDSGTHVVERRGKGDEEFIFVESEEDFLIDAMEKGYDMMEHEPEQNNEDETKEVTVDLHRDDSIRQRILHVSARTHYQLLEILTRQSKASYDSGGIQIYMDSRLGTTVVSSESAMWIALSALMGACCCSFILILTGRWNDEPPQPPPTQHLRPQRRRLTKEQVKRMFPIYQFNGESLELLEDPDGSKEDGDVLQPQLFVPHPLDLECCSICLDEYEPGDRIRCLDPCHHAFHARCVGRWLVERSATCPLCKTELYDPEEEEDNSSEEDEEQPQRRRRTQDQQDQQQNQQGNRNNDTTTTNNNENQEAARAAVAAASFFYAFHPRQINESRGGGTGANAAAGDEEAPLIAVPGPDEAIPREPAASPTATFELSDNASLVEPRRRPWLRTLRQWLTPRRIRSSSNNNNNETGAAGVMEDTTISLSQPLINDSAPPTDSMQQAMALEGNLMAPLESATTSFAAAAAVESAPLLATTTARDNGVEGETEEPIPDPPGGDYANVRQVTI